MSPGGRDPKGKKREGIDINMEEVAHFVNLISICSGALMILSLIAFLLTGSGKDTDVIYTLVIVINATAFFAGRLFVKKFGNKE